MPVKGPPLATKTAATGCRFCGLGGPFMGKYRRFNNRSHLQLLLSTAREVYVERLEKDKLRNFYKLRNFNPNSITPTNQQNSDFNSSHVARF